jgi:hypothetical protein
MVTDREQKPGAAPAAGVGGELLFEHSTIESLITAVSLTQDERLVAAARDGRRTRSRAGGAEITSASRTIERHEEARAK